VEDKLFIFENYLTGSNIRRERWTTYIMPLLADKALSAWTAVAMPTTNANMPLTWDMFRTTMLTAFAHPDRLHKARALLRSPNQSVTEYVRYFNSLVQSAGNPAPSMTDQIMFFQSGLLPYMKDKTATNPATRKFWENLHALQNYAITIQTHGSNKSATMVPASSRAFPSHKPSHYTHKSSRVAFAQATKKKPFKLGKRNDGAGPSNSRLHERAPAGSAEEMRRIMATTQHKQEAELKARLEKEKK